MKPGVDLSTYNNEWYKAEIGASAFKQVLWYFVNICFFKNPFNTFVGLKVYLLRLFGASVGKGVIIKPSVNIKYPWKLSIGDYSWIGEDVWIDNLGKVEIGKNVCLSQGAMLLTGNHNYKRVGFDLMIKPIILEDAVWIGAKAIVCPGVRCGSHAVLTVQSVATAELAAFAIYQGNPAVAIKSRVIDFE